MKSIIKVIILVLLAFGLIAGGFFLQKQLGGAEIQELIKENQALKEEIAKIEKGSPDVEQGQSDVVVEEPVEKPVDKVETPVSITKSDFQKIQTATESFLRETAGAEITGGLLNTFLDPNMKLSGSNNLQLTSAYTNPWNNPYQVEVNDAEKKIVIRSQTDNEKRYVMATYYQNGVVETCTKGFDSGENMELKNLKLQKDKSCGEGLQK